MTAILGVSCSFCSFCDAHLWCQVSRTLTLLHYFQIYIFFSILPFFNCKPHDVISNLICIKEKHYRGNISKMIKDISKTKIPFLCISKCLSTKQKIFFVSNHLVIPRNRTEHRFSTKLTAYVLVTLRELKF